MKKLLILGNTLHSDVLIKQAKQRGVYTIVTDSLSVEESPVKLLADAYWDISVTDIDALEERAGKENVTAVLCGASETCMSAVRELCKRLRLPFQVGDKAWEITNDKLAFKQLCKQCGVPVAKDYQLDLEFHPVDLEKIEYPVVVKPADGCSSIGMHVCRNEEELVAGYKDAYSVSDTKKIVVEKYYSGEEIVLIFAFKDGKATLLDSGDHVGKKQDDIPLVFCTAPTKYMDVYEEKWHIPFEKLFATLGCNDGVGFVQLVMDGDQMAVMEMNYRLLGGQINSPETMCKYTLDYALSEVEPGEVIVPETRRFHAYVIWLKPGQIGKISGLDEIEKNLSIKFMDIRKKEGDVIVPNSGMRQIYAFIGFYPEEKTVAECVEYINASLKIEDIEGNDMAYRYSYEE